MLPAYGNVACDYLKQTNNDERYLYIDRKFGIFKLIATIWKKTFLLSLCLARN